MLYDLADASSHNKQLIGGGWTMITGRAIHIRLVETLTRRNLEQYNSTQNSLERRHQSRG